METDSIKCLLLFFCFLTLLARHEADQIASLDKLIAAQRSKRSASNVGLIDSLGPKRPLSNVYIGSQSGLMEADKIDRLPGQPAGANFDQYSGYVTVDPAAGRALFYYFVEAVEDPSSKPLVLWLNGGPGCSSLGYGSMEELGPFRVYSDGKTLYKNDYSWNSVANVLFLESPAGVGFSYSNTTFDYNLSGDNRTAYDAYTFLVNWFERFPQYKGREFYLSGESYAGHYVPQLAETIVVNNNSIKLVGIAIGNAWIDHDTGTMGMFDYFWTHALNSDEANAAIHATCNFSNETTDCLQAQAAARSQLGGIYIYNIYASLCHPSNQTNGSSTSLTTFDPCTDNYVYSYLNLPEVQTALHANVTRLNYPWDFCSNFVGFFNWNDMPQSVLPTIQQLIDSGVRVWLYSGDMDGRVPITSTRYSIKKLGVALEKSWRPWYSNREVGGYVAAYKGLVLATVRGAGHMVPSDQAQRVLTMFSSFLQGKLPPSTP